MKFLPLLLLLTACSFSLGGMYMGTGSHPWVNVAAKATVGPVEALVAPTTQRGVHDLYAIGVYPALGDEVKITAGAGYAWWREWLTCNAEGYWCKFDWQQGPTAGVGVIYHLGHARIDVRYQYFWDAPFDQALLFTIGVTP